MLPEEREVTAAGAAVAPAAPAVPVDEVAAVSRDDRAQLTRAVRDFEAAQARLDRDAKRVLEQTRADLVSQLLPVLDNLDRTIAAASQNRDAPAVVEGVRLVRSQLEAVIRGYGVERIDARGAVFDPALHDAISAVPVADPRDHNRVIDQIEPGYRYHAQLLRPAKVVVGRHVERPAAASPFGTPRWH